VLGPTAIVTGTDTPLTRLAFTRVPGVVYSAIVPVGSCTVWNLVRKSLDPDTAVAEILKLFPNVECLLSLPAVAGEGFRSLDATPSPFNPLRERERNLRMPQPSGCAPTQRDAGSAKADAQQSESRRLRNRLL
jgi:hypothetical protein